MPSFVPQIVARAGRTSAWLALHHRFLEAHERGDLEAQFALLDEKHELEQQAQHPVARTIARTTASPAPAPSPTVADIRAKHGLLRRPPGRQPVAEWKLPRRT